MDKETQKMIEKLKKKRIELGLSQNKLSKVISVSNTTISRIEDYKMSPTLDMYIRLADALGFEVKLEPKRYFDNDISQMENKKN